MRVFARVVCGCVFAYLSGVQLAHATLARLEWLESPTQKVARLSFEGQVRFVRQMPTPAVAHDLYQVILQIIVLDDPGVGEALEEGRRIPAQSGRPGMEVNLTAMPRSQTRTLTIRLTEPVKMQARQGPNGRSIDFDLGTELDSNSSASLPPMADNAADRHFAVSLQEVPTGSGVNLPRIPSAYQDYAAITRLVPGTTESKTELLLGYFRNAADAERVRQHALAKFPQARVLTLDEKPSVSTPKAVAVTVPEPNPVSLVLTPTLTVQQLQPVQSAVAEAPRPSPQDVAAKGQRLVDDAQTALLAKRAPDAINLLNQALMLPPHPASERAQEMIGLAWEDQGNPDKARVEYQLYQKLYPQGAAAARVQQRLEALGLAPAVVKAGTTSDQSSKSQLKTTGSISQYYYGGNTKTDSLVNIAAGIDQNTLTRTSQSVLVSSWDATSRYQTDESETKLVMRGAHSDNLQTQSALSSTTQGLVSAAYVDYRDLVRHFDMRVGRQSAIGGSLFGLFDGVSFAKPIGNDMKLDGMLGVPANTLISAPQQTLAGVMLEADNLGQNFGGSLSLVEQRTENIVDRRAVGLDMRYFGESVSMFSQVDYDIALQAVNAVTMQGSWQAPSDTTITMLIDDRKAPSLQLSNALIVSGANSLSTMLQTMSMSQVQQQALASAAQARQAMISFSRPLSPKWQGSVDFRWSEVGALPAVGNFQAMPATGAQYNVSLQLSGSNLYSSRDVNGFSLSMLQSDTMRGTQLAYNNLTGIWGGDASLEPSIRLYQQDDNQSTRVVRISPGLRLSYKASQRSSLIGELIYETSQTDGLTNHETSTSMFFYAGYRYDFQ